MNLKAYIKGCNRGDFQWNCIECGTYGDGSAVDVEDVGFKGRVGKITRYDVNNFQTEYIR